MAVDRNGEFSNVGIDLTDQLSSLIYDIYIKLMFEILETDKSTSKRDLFLPYVDGFYVPVSPRIVFTGQVDVRNFLPPNIMHVCSITDYSGTNIKLKGGNVAIGTDVAFYSLFRVDKLPHGYACPGGATTFYRVSVRLPSEDGGTKVSLHTYYLGMRPDGVTSPCYDLRKGQLNDSIAASCLRGIAWEATRCINALDESRFLWRVETSESVIGDTIKTPLSLGVDSEHIKSLFYARQAPLSDSGRKRPILHWVEAHQRRVKSGVDVDISRHLRGITQFDMDGLSFRITSPIKKT
jgi:hypothetical protein